MHPRGRPDPRPEARELSSSEATGAAGTGGLTLCIVNYEGAGYLEETLAAVQRVPGGFREILLVDNASTDDSVAIARACSPALEVVALPENRGPGAARNAGVRRARSDRILFIDNDVRPEPDCPARLSAALDADPALTLVMARIVYRDRPDTIQFDAAQSHFSGVVIPCNSHRPLATTPPPPPCGSLITSCFLLDRSRWGREDLFDESLFMYLEDHEAGLRASLQGHGIRAVGDAVCRHDAGTPGISVRATGRITDVRARQTIRNRWRLVAKLYQARTLLLLAPALLLFELVQAAGAIKKGWLGHWWWALRDTIADRAKLRRDRAEFQRSRRVPDGAVLVGGPLPFNPAMITSPLERIVARMLDAAMGLNWRLVRGALGWRPASAPVGPREEDR